MKQPGQLLREIKRKRWAYFFLAPGWILFAVFTLYPVVETVRISFFNYSIRSSSFTGLSNYTRLFTDQQFRTTLKNCFQYVVILVPAIVLLALFISAAVMNARTKVQSFVRGAFYLPTVVGGVIISAVWLWMYHPLNGLFNHIITSFGGEPVMWLADARYALPALCLVVVTWTVGTPIIIFMAAQLGIAPDLYEAARIDGATQRQLYFRIPLPLMKPVIVFVVIMQIIAVFQLWEVVYLLTNGGPNYSTMSMGYLIYNTAFVSGKYGLAAAQGVVLTLVILFFSMISMRAGRES